MWKIIIAFSLLLSGIAFTQAADTPEQPCAFATDLDRARLYRVPFPDDFYMIGILEPGARYPIHSQNNQFYEVETVDDQTAWVDQRAGGVSNCHEPVLTTEIPLDKFEGTCFIWVEDEVPAYSDSEMTLISPGVAQLSPDFSHHVIRESDDAYLVAFGHAMGAWVAKTDVVDMTPACAAVPLRTGEEVPAGTSAITLENARIWTRPDVKSGIILVPFPPGTKVSVLYGPVSGYIQFDTDRVGDFYWVASDILSGWVWDQRLDFEF